MAYSRWIDSKFYTYWASMNSVYDKGDEVFIVHNDLNPGNILVNLDTMDFRIIDFGFSRCYGDYKRHGICKNMDETLLY